MKMNDPSYIKEDKYTYWLPAVERCSSCWAFPLGDAGINMGSVIDFGHCIAHIALRPAYYTYRTIRLSSAWMTVDQIVDVFNECLAGYGFQFANPRITMSEYKTLDFNGCEEMATMW